MHDTGRTRHPPAPAAQSPDWWSADGVDSTTRTVAMLQVLAEEPAGVSIRAMSDRIGASRSTVHRVLQDLTDAGVTRQADHGVYLMGPRLYELAARVLSGTSLVRLAHSLMHGLVAELGETAYLAIVGADGTDAVHVHRVDCSQPLRYLVPTGTRFPLHAGAAGKAILAYLDELPPGRFEAITESTITRRADLRADLELIRRRGFAVSIEERVRGAGGVAAPLLVEGVILGSLNVSIPVVRIPAGGLESLGPQVRSCAERIASAASVLGPTELRLSWPSGPP